MLGSFVDILHASSIWRFPPHNKAEQHGFAHEYSVGHSLVAMSYPIGCLPAAEPIESKLVNRLWPNDNIVAAPVSR